MDGCLDHGESEHLPLGPATSQPYKVIAKREEKVEGLGGRGQGEGWYWVT